MREDAATGACKFCGKTLEVATGRRRYCGNACRQHAYRSRVSAERALGVGGGPVRNVTRGDLAAGPRCTRPRFPEKCPSGEPAIPPESDRLEPGTEAYERAWSLQPHLIAAQLTPAERCNPSLNPYHPLSDSWPPGRATAWARSNPKGDR